MGVAGPPDPELTELVSSLVEIPSLSGEEGEIQSFIAGWFGERGIAAGIEPAEGGTANVVCEVRGSRPGRTLWLGGHCDTVAPAPGWSTDPFRPTIRDGRLFGLGAMDMKGGLAAAMLAVADLAASADAWAGRVVFAALADEEASSRGARGFLRSDRAIDCAIMGEPHFAHPSTGAIGKFNLRVVATGRSAHGSRPDEGVNAVVEASRLVAVLADLDRPAHPRFGSATHCVLGIASGNGRYEIRVPDRCEFLVNWHVMPGETAAEAVARVERLAADLFSPATFAVSVGEPHYGSFVLDEDHPFAEAFAASYRRVVGRPPAFGFGSAVSDANLFQVDGGIPTILFGPGGANLHAADEWVSLDDLPLVRRLYVDLATTMSPTFEEERS